MRALELTPATAAPVELRAGDPGLSRRVAAAVREAGSAVVRDVDVGDDDALLAVVALAATPSDVGNGGSVIYDVMPRPDAEQVDVSSTERRFPLHTDSTFLPAPHDVIALGCLEATPGGGGESRLLHVDVAIASLLREAVGEARVAALGEVAYPFGVDIDGERVVAPLPIVRRDGPVPTVRYRGDVLETIFAASSIALEQRHRDALDAFEAVLADESLHASYALEPGDVLLVDNRRMLHGRTQIAPGSRRVMRRVKAFA